MLTLFTRRAPVRRERCPANSLQGRYYSRVASPEVADRMVREISTESERVGRHPTPGREHDDFPGLRRLLIHPYTLFFRITDDAAEVARLLHQQRDFFSILGGDAD